MKQYRTNNNIKADKVLLIGKDGTKIGIVTLPEALNTAYADGLDLLEVSGSANPPVCRILDFNKFLYEQKSKEKKSKIKKSDLKEFVLSPKIGEGDLRIRINRGREFLTEGNLVKYTVKFKGREMAFPDIGLTKLKIIVSELSDISEIENEPKLVGYTMSMTLVPKRNK